MDVILVAMVILMAAVIYGSTITHGMNGSTHLHGKLYGITVTDRNTPFISTADSADIADGQIRCLTVLTDTMRFRLVHCINISIPQDKNASKCRCEAIIVFKLPHIDIKKTGRDTYFTYFYHAEEN